MNGRPCDEVYGAFVAAEAEAARQAGLLPSTYLRQVRDPGPLPDVLARLSDQPEHRRAASAYVMRLVDGARVEGARTLLASHRELLAPSVERFGVPAEVLVAIWGVESRFGAILGSTPVLRALATLAACADRKRDFWAGEFRAALALQAQRLRQPDQLALFGSWAGAVGPMQFMPTTARDWAMDCDGDGVADVVSSSIDALGSAANYLAGHGWQRELPWGAPCTLPDPFDWASFGPGASDGLEWRRYGDWSGAGVRVATRDVDAETPVRLVAPDGARGGAFLVTRNFDAILAYNRAIPYALAVLLLAECAAGRLESGSVQTLLPPAFDQLLERSEVVGLQRQLIARGWDTGGDDGIVGPKSRRAIARVQIELGLPADGVPTKDLLNAIGGWPA